MKKEKWMIRNWMLLLMAMLMLVFTGCALLVGAGAGAAGMAYVGGALEVTVKADPPTVEKAVNQAFDVLKIIKVSSSSTPLDAQNIGTMATRTEVTVTTKVLGSGGSRMSIRVGTFGDKATSRRILDEIMKHLPEGQGMMTGTNTTGAVENEPVPARRTP
jgi:hypothetical protein